MTPPHTPTPDDSPQPASERATLQAMLKRAACGDELAWKQLIDAYSTRVYGLIRAQCGNSDLAEEITQSTFCTIVVKIAGYTELGKFEQWLFRIAMNRLRHNAAQGSPVELGINGIEPETDTQQGPQKADEYMERRQCSIRNCKKF